LLFSLIFYLPFEAFFNYCLNGIILYLNSFFKSIEYVGYLWQNLYIVSIQNGVILFLNQTSLKRIHIMTFDNIGLDSLILFLRIAKVIYYEKIFWWIHFFDIDKFFRYFSPAWVENAVEIMTFCYVFFLYMFISNSLDKFKATFEYYVDHYEVYTNIYKEKYKVGDEIDDLNFKNFFKVLYTYFIDYIVNTVKFNYNQNKNKINYFYIKYTKNETLKKAFVYVNFSLIHIFFLFIYVLIPISILYKIMILPILIIIIISFCKNKKFIKRLSLYFSFFIINFLLIVLFKLVQMNTKLKIISFHHLFVYTSYQTFFDIFLGIDNLSLIFLLLTGLLFLIVFLYLYTYEEKNIKLFFSILFLLEFFIFNSFIHYNLFWFFFFFESMVFPMFLIIILGGSRSQKIKASYYFVFFTIIGSIFLFISINYLLIQFGTVNIYKLY
jgi:hypothetical protein